MYSFFILNTRRKCFLLRCMNIGKVNTRFNPIMKCDTFWVSDGLSAISTHVRICEEHLRLFHTNALIRHFLCKFRIESNNKLLSNTVSSIICTWLRNLSTSKWLFIIHLQLIGGVFSLYGYFSNSHGGHLFKVCR